MFDNAIKSVLTEQFENYKATQIVNLKLNKEYKYSACVTMLNQLSTDIVCKLLDVKPKFTDSAILKRAAIERWLKDYTFDKTTFNSRKKNIERGENNPLKINEGGLVESRSFSYKGHYKGYKGCYDQSDFALLFHRSKPEFIYRNNEMKKFIKIDLKGVSSEFQLFEARYILNNETKIVVEPYDPTKHKIYTRVSSLVNSFRVLQMTWNEEEHAFSYKNEVYHVSSGDLWTVNEPHFIHCVIKSFAAKNKMIRQRSRLENLKTFVENNLTSIFVTFSDSLKSGNCEAQTSVMYSTIVTKVKQGAPVEMFQMEGEKITAVRADYLLSLRNDHYTQNAIFQAAKSVYK
jgi:hypothetical protein